MKKTDYYILSSVYTNLQLREKVIDILKRVEYTKTLQDTSDVDLELLVKHCSQARRIFNRKFINLFFLFLVSIALYLFIPLEILVAPLFIVLLTSYIYLTYEDFSWKSFVRQKIKDKDIADMPLKKFDNELVELTRKYKSNSIHYYKEYNPFSNHGYLVGGWSLPIDTTKPNNPTNSDETKSFDEKELYETITKRLTKLNFENLITEDCLFVNTDDITKDHLFFNNDKLLNKPTEELINKFNNSKSERVRYYKMIKIKDWGNELVFTSLIRIYKSSENLFLETKFFILPSLIKETKEIDKLKNNIQLKEGLSILAGNVFYTPLLLISSPLIIIGDFIKSSGIIKSIQGLFMNDDELEQLIGISPSIDRIFRSEYYEDYYQIQDRDFYLKTVEKRILNSIIDFLDEHNIDISDFKDSKTHILNNGIIMSGGEMKASNIAVGSKNKIQVTSNE